MAGGSDGQAERPGSDVPACAGAGAQRPPPRRAGDARAAGRHGRRVGRGDARGFPPHPRASRLARAGRPCRTAQSSGRISRRVHCRAGGHSIDGTRTARSRNGARAGPCAGAGGTSRSKRRCADNRVGNGEDRQRSGRVRSGLTEDRHRAARRPLLDAAVSAGRVRLRHRLEPIPVRRSRRTEIDRGRRRLGSRGGSGPGRVGRIRTGGGNRDRREARRSVGGERRGRRRYSASAAAGLGTPVEIVPPPVGLRTG